MDNFLYNVQQATSDLITDLKRELRGYSSESSSGRYSSSATPQSNTKQPRPKPARPLADDLSSISSISSLSTTPFPTSGAHKEVIMRSPSEMSFAFINIDGVESICSALSESTEEHKVTIERWVDQMIELGGTGAVEGLPTIPSSKDLYLILDSLIGRLERKSLHGGCQNIGKQQHAAVVNVLLELDDMLAESHLSIQQDEERSGQIARWLKASILKPNTEITPNESRLLMHLSWPISRALLTEFRDKHPNSTNRGAIEHILMVTDPDQWSEKT